MKYKLYLLSAFVIITIAWLLIWYFIGRYYVPDFEDEDYYKYFLKEKPAFIFEFENPLVMFPELRRRMYKDGKGLSKLALYCHYRYGFKGSNEEVINQCGQLERIDLLND